VDGIRVNHFLTSILCAYVPDQQITNRRGTTPEAVLSENASRHQIERLIDVLKNETGQRRLCTAVNPSVEGRLFLAFAGLVLHAALEERMRQAGLLRRTTVAELLGQLRKTKAVTTRTGKRVLLELTRRQRDLLARLKIPAPA
jgi:transposase